MIFSTTERASFRRCKRMWILSSFNGNALEPVRPNAAFSLGTGIHKALEKWAIDPTCDPALEYQIAATNMYEAAKTAYTQRNGFSPSDEEMSGILDTFSLGTAMMRNYQDFWKFPLPPDFTLIKPEQKVLVSVPGCDHQLEMRLDAIIADAQKRLYIGEHKTFSTHPNEETLRYSDQFLTYTWGLTQLDLGEVAGVAYDGLWKRPSPPKGRIAADLFTRVLIKPSKQEIAELGMRLPYELDEMARYVNNASQAALMKNYDDRCVRLCGMNKLCIAMSRGEDTQFVIQQSYKPREEFQREDE